MANESQKCQQCSSPATHHVVKIIDGKAHSYLLCAEHAQSISPILKNTLSKTQQVNLVSLIQHFINQQHATPAEGESEATQSPLCPNCHLRYAQYKKTLLLGCSDCYEAFESLLTKDLRKFHGAISQDGDDSRAMEPEQKPGLKAKKSQTPQIPKAEMAGLISLEHLQKELATAIKSEDFEKAAHLRDQIRAFGAKQQKKEKPASKETPEESH